MARHTPPPLFALALAGLLASTAHGGGPVRAADVGDPDVLREEPGVELDDPVDQGLPEPAIPPPPQAETSTTIDVDVGEAPEFELTVDEDDDIADVGGQSLDVDVPETTEIIEDPPLGTAAEAGAPLADLPAEQAAEVPGDPLDMPAGPTSTPAGTPDMVRPGIRPVPDLEVTDPESDPIAPDVDVGRPETGVVD